MKVERDNAWVLSAIELNICAQILGRKDWQGFPVWKTEESLEQRMLEGFLHLTELGLLEPAEEKFRCSEIMRERLECVVWPEVIYAVRFPHQMPRTLYQREKRRVLMEQILARGQSCRVMSVTDESWEELLCGEQAETWNAQAGRGSGPDVFVPGANPEELLGQSKCLIQVMDGMGELLRFLRVFQNESGVWLASMGAETCPYSGSALAAALGQE